MAREAPLALALDSIRLLREMATGPRTALFVAEHRARAGSGLVAVKVLADHDPRHLDKLLRLRDHGRRLDRLGHRNLVCATEVGQVGSYLALLSPYVDGIDLLEWVEVHRELGQELPLRVVCEIIRATAATLDAALNRVPWGHAEPLGRIHRDLKPSNLMVSRDGELKVLDLGAGFTTRLGRRANPAVLREGLARYLSPQRRTGLRPTPADDIYATGVLALEVIRGRWLRRMRSRNPAHDRHLAQVVAGLGRLPVRSEADDRTLRSILLRMVAFDPDARPHADEVAQTFRRLGDRTRGPTLETWAHEHAVPWLEPLPEAPDPQLEDFGVALLEKGHTLPEPDEEREPLPLSLVVTDEMRSEWDETDEGWAEAEDGGEEPATTEELADDVAAALIRARTTAEIPLAPAGEEGEEREITARIPVEITQRIDQEVTAIRPAVTPAPAPSLRAPTFDASLDIDEADRRLRVATAVGALGVLCLLAAIALVIWAAIWL